MLEQICKEERIKQKNLFAINMPYYFGHKNAIKYQNSFLLLSKRKKKSFPEEQQKMLRLKNVRVSISQAGTKNGFPHE